MGSGSKFKRQQKKEKTQECNYVEADVGLIRDWRISSNTVLNDEDGGRRTSPGAFRDN